MPNTRPKKQSETSSVSRSIIQALPLSHAPSFVLKTNPDICHLVIFFSIHPTPPRSPESDPRKTLIGSTYTQPTRRVCLCINNQGIINKSPQPRYSCVDTPRYSSHITSLHLDSIQIKNELLILTGLIGLIFTYFDRLAFAFWNRIFFSTQHSSNLQEQHGMCLPQLANWSCSFAIHHWRTQCFHQ
jgi:hypothetical protein